MIAIRDAYRAGLLKSPHLLSNVVSGVIVGVVALPLAMAFAIASGVKPEQGIYTAIIAGIVVALFGGSRVQIAGPTGAFIVILAAITAKHGVDGLQIATFMAGAMLVAMGLAGMGSVIKFIPDPVIVGFTAGIGVIIFVGEWKDFFGLAPVLGAHFHEKLWHLIQALPRLHVATTMIAVLSLSLLIIVPRIPRLSKVPSPLVALVVATLLQAVFEFDGVTTIGSAFGGIPEGLPSFALPTVTLDRIIELIGPAFTIALLGSIESLLSAVVADGMAGTKHNSNQELVGQGIANLATPLFGGFAATGAIARTATNIRNGGTSPIAGVVHSATLVLIILFLAPLASNIPLAALAAILFVVAYNMSEAKHFVHMVRKAPRADVAILLITFVLTIFTDLVIAVNIGVILATLHFLRRMASSVEVVPIPESEINGEVSLPEGVSVPPGVLVYGIEGPFFFAAAEHLQLVLSATHTDPNVLVIRLRRVPFIDMTGLQALEEAIAGFQKRGVTVVLCEANDRVKAKLDRAGLVDLIGSGSYFETLQSAMEAVVAMPQSAGGNGHKMRRVSESLIRTSRKYLERE